jgi:type I restriction enzyme M protein
MLDAETKRRIDSCRDILVGKVPDPKSQVEQITIALIYKFMDDMDAEAEELGGTRSFFANDYARFGWARLMAPGLGGFEVLALYSEAIQKMNENPGVPPLFRDIFKNAYLPYRDPETLKSFLKEINYFTYDHSERLGDAFEYLLSVLGSQGDAGQFRTPRHIIDFMVEVMDPKKNETILDPACGTAGFLISAWKHILKTNTSKAIKKDSTTLATAGIRAGDLLTPDERARLAASIHGYDISPDMVRLSLVNLYLHGFTHPRVEEYDTLTQDDKWNEMADVILANPPFMSPKGGIKPHRRFSVQATRSEVLFVDYMAEHLTATGRAAIVVPEGIIFQSGTAYKSLRKMLVNTSLVAVVSLPAGVFNPYSGVKTSILILDKRLHKQLDRVLFVKVGNDGFNLGAQRRAVVDSHLPEATRLLRGWMTAPEKFEGDGVRAQAVTRAKLGESGDFNLSGERYLATIAVANVFPMTTLRDICEINPETLDPAKEYSERHFEYIDIASIENETGNYLGGTQTIGTEAPSRARRKVRHLDVLLSTVRPNLRAFALLRSPSANAVASTGFAVLRAKTDLVLPGYLIWLLRSYICVEQMVGMSGKGAYPSINSSDVETIQIPLPPIEVQHEIVAEIEGYQKIIDGARQVLDNYKPHIVVNPDWSFVPLGEVCDINPKKSQLDITDPNMAVAFVPMSDISERDVFFAPKEQRPIGEVFKQYTYFEDEDVLLAKVTPCFENGKSGIARQLTGGIGFGSSEFYVLRARATKVLPEWLYFQVTTDRFRTLGAAQMTGTGGLQRVPRDFVSGWAIPLPDLPTQRAIVAEIKAEQALVNANRELMLRMEAKVRAAIDRVWGEVR